MRMAHIRIENFKGLRDVETSLSRFVCLIGENNSGKSSVLQAVSYFIHGGTLSKMGFYDPCKDVRIQVLFDDIGDDDIALVGETHQSRVRNIVKNGRLTLVRIFGNDGKGVLKIRKLRPRDPRFSTEELDKLTKGKRPGKPFLTAVLTVFPELKDKATTETNKDEMLALIDSVGDGLPDDQKDVADAELPTGIPQGITPMFPEVVFIQAVKDLKDEVKTTESTPFGKVIGLLLQVIEPELKEEAGLFEKLNKKLNRCLDVDGKEVDGRLDAVKLIEKTVEKNVRECFRSVSLELLIPPPELKSVLSSAHFKINDGVVGTIETKGDGLRRAIVFGIFRSYMELGKAGVLQADGSKNPRLLLLFEEPELFLHPKAQQILFNALGTFADKHQVLVTTHSPSFLGPQFTTTFIKMRKKEATDSAPPYGTITPIDLSDLNSRDQFQLICYENNSIAFFAEKVILVEGDSDYIALPHFAKLLHPSWDCSELPIRFARLNSKSSVRRYRTFFAHFDMETRVIVDLDFVIGSEFKQIDPSPELEKLRKELLDEIDRVVLAAGSFDEITEKKAKEAQCRGDLKALWLKAKKEWKDARESGNDLVAAHTALEEFFAWDRKSGRLKELASPTSDEGLRLKRELLRELRRVGVCVWEKGGLEDYYPDGMVGDGKPELAQNVCKAITTRDECLKLCDDDIPTGSGELTSEFELVFETVLGSVSNVPVVATATTDRKSDQTAEPRQEILSEKQQRMG